MIHGVYTPGRVSGGLLTKSLFSTHSQPSDAIVPPYLQIHSGRLQLPAVNRGPKVLSEKFQK